MDGFLSRTITRVRDLANEPATNAKYSSAKILDHLASVYRKAFAELNRTSPVPVTVQFDFTTAQSQLAYQLPPHIGTIRRLDYIATDGTLVNMFMPRSFRHFADAGILLQPGLLTFTGTTAPSAYTIRIHYTPNGCATLHEGSIDASSAIDSTTETYKDIITLAASPTTGSLDTRANAFAGCTYRVLSDTVGAGAQNFVQERLIASYDNVTRKATTFTAFDPLPGGTTHLYEIAPPLDDAVDMIVAIGIARRLVSGEGDTRAYTHLTQMYREEMRELRMEAANLTSFNAGSLPNDGYLNRRSY